MKTLSEKIAVMQAAERGEKIEKRYRLEAGARFVWAGSGDYIEWDWVGYDYRVAREEPSIDWNAVAPEFQWLAVDKFKRGYVYSEEPHKGEIEFRVDERVRSIPAQAFSSFRPGNIP